MKRNLKYSDVCWVPRYSSLGSRNDSDVSVEFAGKRWKVPCLPSNMETTISFELAEWLSDNNYFYILHRFYPYDRIREWVKKNQSRYVSISVGVQEIDKELLLSLKKYKIDCLTIDIAHGFSIRMKEMVNFIKSLYKDKDRPFLIAGNVAGDEASINFLLDLGVDAIKVGLAFGKACKTYNETGVGSPMFSAGLQASRYANVPLIGDGGVRERGDIVKALISGFKIVMAGSMFSACIDSPADVVDGKKMYYGSASEMQRKRMGASIKYVEGATIELPMNGLTYEQLLARIEESIRSGISYAGGKDLSCFPSVDWIEL